MPARGSIDDGAWARWRALAARAGDDDLILGAQILTKRFDGEPAPERLAQATGDAWFQLAIEIAQAKPQALTQFVRPLRAGHPVLGRAEVVAAITSARGAPANAQRLRHCLTARHIDLKLHGVEGPLRGHRLRGRRCRHHHKWTAAGAIRKRRRRKTPGSTRRNASVFLIAIQWPRRGYRLVFASTHEDLRVRAS